MQTTAFPSKSMLTDGSKHKPRTESALERQGTFLRRLKDKHGHLLHLHETYIRLYSFNIGVLRFAVRSAAAPPRPHHTHSTDDAIDVQALLDLQNSVMRLNDPKKAGCAHHDRHTIHAPPAGDCWCWTTTDWCRAHLSRAPSALRCCNPSSARRCASVCSDGLPSRTRARAGSATSTRTASSCLRWPASAG